MAETYVDPSRMRYLVWRAVDAGAVRLSAARWQWNIAGSCESPYTRLLWSTPLAHPRKYIANWGHFDEVDERGDYTGFVISKPEYRWALESPVVTGITGQTLQIDLLTRCRKCRKCRLYRAAMWRERADAETKLWPRTWFVTLTLAPEHLFKMRLRASRTVPDWESKDDAQRFGLLAQEIGKEITLYLKRVRKDVGTKSLRYLCVCEAHKSGNPHFHLLVHETNPMTPVRHRHVTMHWKLGFIQAKLVTDVAQAHYLAKYLSKDAKARVRASVRYGKSVLDLIASHSGGVQTWTF